MAVPRRHLHNRLELPLPQATKRLGAPPTDSDKRCWIYRWESTRNNSAHSSRCARIRTTDSACANQRSLTGPHEGISPDSTLRFASSERRTKQSGAVMGVPTTSCHNASKRRSEAGFRVYSSLQTQAAEETRTKYGTCWTPHCPPCPRSRCRGGTRRTRRTMSGIQSATVLTPGIHNTRHLRTGRLPPMQQTRSVRTARELQLEIRCPNSPKKHHAAACQYR
jgi:hypothetical protein